jgi:excisionase family DNA binding protein
MTDPSPTLETILESLIRRILREEVQSLQNDKEVELLTAEELAEGLKLPISWVYEQSRQGNLPTHRLGRYIRFDLQEVLISQKKT